MPEITNRQDGQYPSIEELAKRNTELEREIYLLQTVFNNLPDLVYVKDRDCRFVVANDALVQLIGAETAEQVIGKDDFDFFPEDLARAYFEDEQQFFNSGENSLTLEQPRLDTTTGEQGWILTSKIVFRDENGDVAGLIGIGRDVSELKLAQQSLQEQLQIIKSQREVLEELSTPIIPITDHIIIMPLIGAIDTARARNIMRSLLAGITEHRAHVIILDITGVPLVDTGVADHLNRTIQAARLKGAETIVTGISDAVAETIVDLGINWGDLDTVRDLQTGLKIALKRLRDRLTDE
jgi:rsbT co-antagonist protein RsbR